MARAWSSDSDARRAILRGHPRAVDEDEEALRLGDPLAPDHVEDRGARLDLQLDPVAGARLGREALGEGGEELEGDPHPAPQAGTAVSTYACMTCAGSSISLCFQAPSRRRPSMSPRNAPTWSAKPTQLAPTRRSPSNCRFR